jgi:uncharacterized protein (TIGR04222 family)
MNPFDLPGPEFLLFYLILGAMLLIVLFALRRYGEPDPSTPVQLTEPYEIAYLRGGANEVLRLATVGLIDRGLLDVKDKRVKVTDPAQAKQIRHPVDHALLESFRSGGEATAVFSNSYLKGQCDSYTRKLTELGLLPDEQSNAQRRTVYRAVVGVLLLVAAVKIALAIERGRRNLAGLIVLAIVFLVLASAIGRVKRTKRGEVFLKHMRELLDGLRQRSSMFVPRANTNELLLMGAVFGMAALPVNAYPYVMTLYPKAASSTSGCGSSCGGGGCGGGCGGCGS